MTTLNEATSQAIDGQKPHVHSPSVSQVRSKYRVLLRAPTQMNPVNLFVLHLIGYYWEQNVHEKQPHHTICITLSARYPLQYRGACVLIFRLCFPKLNNFFNFSAFIRFLRCVLYKELPKWNGFFLWAHITNGYFTKNQPNLSHFNHNQNLSHSLRVPINSALLELPNCTHLMEVSVKSRFIFFFYLLTLFSFPLLT